MKHTHRGKESTAGRKARDGNARKPSPAKRGIHWAAVIAVLLLAILPYLNTLGNDFALDDVDIVAKNPMVRDGNVAKIFATNYWGGALGASSQTDIGLYRPLTVSTFAIEHRLWGAAPAGYHAMNVAVHAGNTLLVLRVASTLVPSLTAAVIAAAVFAVHPVHTEAVAEIVGRADLLSTLFFMLAFLALRLRSSEDGTEEFPRTPRVAGGALLYLLAVFSKESAATLPIVLLLDDWLRRGELRTDRAAVIRALAIRYGLLALAAGFYLAIRHQAVTGASSIWLGFAGVAAGARILTAIRVISEYLALLVFPRMLLADYWTTNMPIAHSLFEPGVLLALFVLVTIAAGIVYFRRERALLFGAGFFAITLLPVSNLLFPIGIGKAERLLYLPSVGFCLVIAWGVSKAVRAKSPRWLVPAIAAPILLLLSARTVRRNEDWRDQLTIALATLRDSPTSPLMNDLAGLEFAKSNDLDRALSLFSEAVRLAPQVAVYHAHRGTAYYARGQLAGAERELKIALQIRPGDADARNTLGAVFLASKNYDAAVAEFNAALRTNPGNADAHSNLGLVHMERGRPDLAEQEFREALRLQPDLANAQRGLATLQRLPMRPVR